MASTEQVTLSVSLPMVRPLIWPVLWTRHLVYNVDYTFAHGSDLRRGQLYSASPYNFYSITFQFLVNFITIFPSVYIHHIDFMSFCG